MKATPQAMIKVRALMLEVPDNIGGNVVAKEDRLLCSCQRSEMQVVPCKPQDEGQVELQTAWEGLRVPVSAEANMREVHI